MAVAICCNNHYRVCPLEIIPLRFENNESHLRSSPNRVENHTLCVWKHQAVWGFPSFWIIKAVLFSSSASGLPVRLCCCLPHLSFPETISRALHWHLSHLRWFKNTEREREGERERYIYIYKCIYIYILYTHTYMSLSVAMCPSLFLAWSPLSLSLSIGLLIANIGPAWLAGASPSPGQDFNEVSINGGTPMAGWYIVEIPI